MGPGWPLSPACLHHPAPFLGKADEAASFFSLSTFTTPWNPKAVHYVVSPHLLSCREKFLGKSIHKNSLYPILSYSSMPLPTLNTVPAMKTSFAFPPTRSVSLCIDTSSSRKPSLMLLPILNVYSLFLHCNQCITSQAVKVLFLFLWLFISVLQLIH